MPIASITAAAAATPVADLASPAVWAGIIGGGVALLVMFFNNLFLFAREERKIKIDAEREKEKNRIEAARDQQKYQIDAEQKSLDRTMALRKEVYLPLATALQDAIKFLGGLASTKPGEMEPLNALAVAVARLHVVAETPTSILAADVVSHIGVIFFELSAAARPSIDAMDDAELAKKLILEAKENVRVAQSDMDRFLRSAVVNDKVFGALERNVAAYRSEVNEYSVKQCDALAQHAKYTAAFARVMLEKMPVLAELSLSLTLAIRCDMGQISDEDAFRLSIQHSQENVLRAGRRVLDSIEAGIELPQESS